MLVGSVSFPVLVDDNGTQYETQMLADQFAHETVSSVPDESELDTVCPRTDWCIAYIGKPAEERKYKDGEKSSEQKEHCLAGKRNCQCFDTTKMKQMN